MTNANSMNSKNILGNKNTIRLCCICEHAVSSNDLENINYLAFMKKILHNGEDEDWENLDTMDHTTNGDGALNSESSHVMNGINNINNTNEASDTSSNDEATIQDERCDTYPDADAVDQALGGNVSHKEPTSLAYQVYKHIVMKSQEMSYKHTIPFGLNEKILIDTLYQKLSMIGVDCMFCFGMFKSLLADLYLDQFNPRPKYYTMHFEVNEVSKYMGKYLGRNDISEIKSRLKAFAVKYLYEMHALELTNPDASFEIISKVMSEQDAKKRCKKRKRIEAMFPGGKSNAKKIATSKENHQSTNAIQAPETLNSSTLLENSIEIISTSNNNHRNSTSNGTPNSNSSKHMTSNLSQTYPRVRFEYYYKPVFVTGRYLKLQRGISHSCWFIGDNRIGQFDTSVEKEITNSLKETFRTETIVFCSSGREDIDVRMLGTGRPFGCRIERPLHIPDEIETLTPMSGQGNYIEIHNPIYHKFDNIAFDRMNLTITEKKKRYRCLVITSTRLPTELKLVDIHFPLILKQKTPLRVLHRRSERIRDKEVFQLDIIERLNDFSFILDIETSSGTYIKEFCHGDFGRTRPSLPELMENFEGECDIIQLDVIQLVE